MNQTRFTQLSYALLLLVLVACQAQATAVPATAPLPATEVPPTVAPATATVQGLTIFTPKTFNLPITFSYGAGWKLYEEYTDDVALTDNNPDGYLAFINPKSIKIASPTPPYSAIPFPSDFSTWIQSHGLFQNVKTQPVVVGGVNGTQIDADASPNCKHIEWLILASTGWNCDVGGHYHFVYLDNVNDKPLLIMVEGVISAKEFASRVDATQQVLDTVVFSNVAAAASAQTTFSPKTFKPITSLSFGSDWHVEEDLLHSLLLENGPTVAINFYIIPDANLPNDFTSWIRSNPDFQTNEPTQVTVGGISGIQIDAMPIMKTDKEPFGLGMDWNILKSDGQYRFIFIDNVKEEHLLIFLVAPTGKLLNSVPELQQEFQDILDSVLFSIP